MLHRIGGIASFGRSVTFMFIVLLCNPGSRELSLPLSLYLSLPLSAHQRISVESRVIISGIKWKYKWRSVIDTDGACVVLYNNGKDNAIFAKIDVAEHYGIAAVVVVVVRMMIYDLTNSHPTVNQPPDIRSRDSFQSFAILSCYLNSRTTTIWLASRFCNTTYIDSKFRIYTVGAIVFYCATYDKSSNRGKSD